MANRGRVSPKDPDDDARYGIDEAGNITAGATITNAEVLDVTGGATADGPVDISGTVISTVVSGGTHGNDCELTFRYDTSDSQQFDVTILIPIRSSDS